MKYEIIVRNFMDDNTTIVLDGVDKVEFSEDSFVVFLNSEGLTLGAFDIESVKGFFKTK
jgi:hypothetical protein